MNLPQRLENFSGTIGEQILLGSIVGDGCLFRRTKSTEIQLAHSEKQKDYLLWKVDILKKNGINFYNYECLYGLNQSGKIQYCSKNSNVIPKYKTIFYHSNSYIELNDYYKMFYRGRQKIIRRKILNMFQPLALAIWIQDDGNLNYSNRMIRLATHCFSEKEHKMMVKYFKTVWHLTVRIKISKGKYFCLQFGTESTKRLIEIIKPYIHPTMQYKIELKPMVPLKERWKKLSNDGMSTRFNIGHPYYPRKNSLNGNQVEKLDDIV